ncbi:MAG TPA: ABC transporter ATP-binding protein [Burkholderiaceae bacterium]|nr:ABC transporter ATP-binding protein [Burkholderiaceae bacterium]
MAAATALTPAVRVHGLCLSAGARTLVERLDVAITAGERWAVLGPNGAGKSTLLATLGGVRPAPVGEIEVLGLRVLPGAAHLAVEELAERRALVTDRWHDPFAATVLDTVLTARYRFGDNDGAGEHVARAALARVDALHLATRDVRRLSRGERQRVAIATALAQETPLLLLDEPIAHQDPRHQVLLLDALAQLADRTLVVTLHDVNAAFRFATHALLLWGDGRWQAGRAQELLTPDNLAALFGTRFSAVEAGGVRVLVQTAGRVQGGASRNDA